MWTQVPLPPRCSTGTAGKELAKAFPNLPWAMPSDLLGNSSTKFPQLGNPSAKLGIENYNLRLSRFMVPHRFLTLNGWQQADNRSRKSRWVDP